MDFAFALGFSSADHFLASITVSQWMEWVEWVNIRGPIGGPRQDFYAANLAMHAGGPYADPKEITLDKFVMPWLKPGEVNVADFITPWVSDEDEQD